MSVQVDKAGQHPHAGGIDFGISRAAAIWVRDTTISNMYVTHANAERLHDIAVIYG